MFRLFPIICMSFLASCSAYVPSNTEDACQIFEGNIDWYRDVKISEKRWGMPAHVIMAFVYQESSYRAKARPKRPTFFFIPLPRRSSAYGYAQAQDPAWNDYRRETGNWGHDRDDFKDAVNFIGWYSNKSTKVLGIAKRDAYSQYLAYHEGWTGYRNKSFKKKPSLIKAAEKVRRISSQYEKQLHKCEERLRRKSKKWWFFN